MSGTGVKQWTIQRGRGHYSTPWTPLSHTPGYLTTRRYANTVFTLPSGRATVVIYRRADPAMRAWRVRGPFVAGERNFSTRPYKRRRWGGAYGVFYRGWAEFEVTPMARAVFQPIAHPQKPLNASCTERVNSCTCNSDCKIFQRESVLFQIIDVRFRHPKSSYRAPCGIRVWGPICAQSWNNRPWPDVVKYDWTRLCLSSVLAQVSFDCFVLFTRATFIMLHFALPVFLFSFVVAPVRLSVHDWPERLVSKMTYNVSTGTLNPAHSLTHSLTPPTGSYNHKRLVIYSFYYPRDVSAVTRCLSVCLSVRHTPVLCLNG